ncbi:alpha/beta fold hydrolase [Paraburkholderia caballeronis]|uniref:alpha/beta fold hydrolase n=1 Tax=Paraburkholderia caballeronis TaxID=416943 RepID=UPI0010661649|nr:alpha/beta fold hydrolase [Paraburkholderia caballeronis]
MANTMHLNGQPFMRRFVGSGDIRFHIVDGGVGPTVVLLAGFPQTAYAWRRIQPLLAGSCRTIAIGLPGQGYSDKPADGYDTQTASTLCCARWASVGISTSATTSVHGSRTHTRTATPMSSMASSSSTATFPVSRSNPKYRSRPRPTGGAGISCSTAYSICPKHSLPGGNAS